MSEVVIIDSYCSYYGRTYHSLSRETWLSDCLGQMIFVPQGIYSAYVCVCVCGLCEFNREPVRMCRECVCVGQ